MVRETPNFLAAKKEVHTKMYMAQFAFFDFSAGKRILK